MVYVCHATSNLFGSPCQTLESVYCCRGWALDASLFVSASRCCCRFSLHPRLLQRQSILWHKSVLLIMGTDWLQLSLRHNQLRPVTKVKVLHGNSIRRLWVSMAPAMLSNKANYSRKIMGIGKKGCTEKKIIEPSLSHQVVWSLLASFPLTPRTWCCSTKNFFKKEQNHFLAMIPPRCQR